MLSACRSRISSMFLILFIMVAGAKPTNHVFSVARRDSMQWVVLPISESAMLSTGQEIDAIDAALVL